MGHDSGHAVAATDACAKCDELRRQRDEAWDAIVEWARAAIAFDELGWGTEGAQRELDRFEAADAAVRSLAVRINAERALATDADDDLPPL